MSEGEWSFIGHSSVPTVFPSPSLLLHHIFLSSSLLSAACCTVWVSLWGLHSVSMCLGWQTGLTHLPGAFLPPPPSIISHCLPLTRCTFVCISISLLCLVRMSVCSIRLSVSFSLSFCFSPSRMMQRGAGLVSNPFAFREGVLQDSTYTPNPCWRHTQTFTVQHLKIEDEDRQAGQKGTNITADRQEKSRWISRCVCMLLYGTVTHAHIGGKKIGSLTSRKVFKA